MSTISKKVLAQLLVESCVQQGIRSVVISPGSRNAPLTLSFVNHKDIEVFSIVDERAAAFFALGMAQQTGEAVALLCTSGSALLNYYPAVAEAYYSNLPLVVLSADRPQAMIDIGDGQTIRQQKVFEAHILFEAHLTEMEEEGLNDLELLERNAKLIREAFDTCQKRGGPVHLNVPFDEPLYEMTDQPIDFGPDLLGHSTEQEQKNSLLDEEPLALEILEPYAEIWNGAAKKMVVLGCLPPDELLQVQLEHLMKDPSVLVFCEAGSNVHHPEFIRNIDQLIFSFQKEDFEDLKPEILLTFGGMVVSKKIKQFLRAYSPDHHWHIDPFKAMDTYGALTKHFALSPGLFFSQFFFLTQAKSFAYRKPWLDLRKRKHSLHEAFKSGVPYSDWSVFSTLLGSIPEGWQVQLGNSSVVRYAQLFQLDPTQQFFSNRGTSGIDGCTSTAIGAALKADRPTVLFTGDLSFFYDSNALWNKYIRKDFRIVLINNGGGGIFKILPGPKKTKALDFFETPHNLDASHLCKMFGFRYSSAKDQAGLEEALKDFYPDADEGSISEAPALLEVKTMNIDNEKVLMDYFGKLKAADAYRSPFSSSIPSSDSSSGSSSVS